MSPAESEGLNKKSLVLPETKISLKLIRSSGIVKRGILEAVVRAPVVVQAALFLGLKVFLRSRANMTSRGTKNPPTNFDIYQGDFRRGLSSKRPKTK